MHLPLYIKESLELNDKDATIYLDLLQSGQSAVSTISARTYIDRTTVYSVLKRLMNKGVVSKTPQKNQTLFFALDPDIFRTKLQNEIEKKESELEAVAKFIPTLANIKNINSNKPLIQIFEGPSGIISLYELMLKNNKKEDAFLTIDTLPNALKKYLRNDYIKNKKKNKVFSRVIIQDSKKASKYKDLDHKSNRKTKIIPKEKFPFETEIIIGANDEVAIIDFQAELLGVYIRSKTIRNTLKGIFESLWNSCL